VTVRDSELGIYDGQPVLEGDGGRLVYDCQPETADGCLIPVPSDFLGIPHAYVTEISVPDFGDGGVQRLHNHMGEPDLEPEA
jgi:hypothetical protein